MITRGILFMKNLVCNKKVYLFELDSIKNSDQEILQAQKAIYHEIVQNRNGIVVTYNQLIDSRLFVSMIQNEKYFNILIELFRLGYISTSMYGKFRTVSQYMQNALLVNKSLKNDSFIFSSFPLKDTQKRLISLIQRALQYSDLSEINDYITANGVYQKETLALFVEFNGMEEMPITITIEEAKSQLSLIRNLLRLIILISISELSANPAIDYDKNYPQIPFSSFMDAILKSSREQVCNNLIRNNWDSVKEILNKCKKELIADCEKSLISGIDNRSVWLKKIKDIYQENDRYSVIELKLSQIAVNLSYNYTVEHSIYGVSKHYSVTDFKNSEYQSFYDDFFSRSLYELNSEKSRQTASRFSDNQKYYCEFRIWERIIRTVKQRKGNLKNPNLTNNVLFYEENYYTQRKKEKIQNVKIIGSKIFVFLIYVFLIAITNFALSFFEDSVGVFLDSFLLFSLIIVLSAIIDKISPQSNILDCAKNICVLTIDLFASLNIRINSYINKTNLNKHSTELLPNYVKKRSYSTDAIKQYINLVDSRPNAFAESDIIQIVNPKYELTTISKYELNYGVKIGVVYKSKFYSLVTDLIKSDDGQFYVYERLLQTTDKGSVVIIPRFDDKFILVNQFRHAIRAEQLAFPRGFGELSKNGMPIADELNAIKELHEEINAEVLDIPKSIGVITPDSGILGNWVSVFVANISNYYVTNKHEGIKSIIAVTEDELNELVANGAITDGFTLAALSLYQKNREFYNSN